MSQAIEQRIDRIESRFAMQDIVSDYYHGFDERDWDRFLAIWWEDAQWEIGPPFGKFADHDGIAHVTKDILWEAWLTKNHFTTNQVLVFEGLDSASGVCDVDCVGMTSDGEAQTISPTYYDDFECRDKRWKTVHRKVKVHHFNPLPGVTLNPPN